MTLNLDTLKADELQLIAQINALQGTLGYNRRLQAFIQQEEEEEKCPDQPESPSLDELPN